MRQHLGHRDEREQLVRHEPSAARALVQAGDCLGDELGAYLERHHPQDARRERDVLAGVPASGVARFAGTSLTMLERTYAHLLSASTESARARLDAFTNREAADTASR